MRAGLGRQTELQYRRALYDRASCRLTVSLSGRPLPEIARHARTIDPARVARHSSSHGRSKRWLAGISAPATICVLKRPMWINPEILLKTEWMLSLAQEEVWASGRPS
jgi:hypothetical protein